MLAFTALAAATAALVAAPVQAWWDNGHMLVGEVASQLLTSADRSTIECVLRDWDRSFPNTNTVSTAAIWPDLIKCSKNSTSCTTPLLPTFTAMDKWHYVNLPLNANGTQWGSAAPDINLFKFSFGGEAADVFDKFLATFNTTKSLWTANLALRQLIHIVADVHQPLHAVAAVSEKYPGGDSGGNLYTFTQPCVSTNLHALYDSVAGEYNSYWSTNMTALRPLLKANATALISTLSTIQDAVGLSSLSSLAYPQFSAAMVSGSYFKKMIFESYQLATSVVYPGFDTTFTGNNVACPTPEYLAQVVQISKQRIALAGKRLSLVLTKVAQQFRANKLAY